MIGLLRIALALIVVTLLVTYAIIPFIKYIKKFLNKETKRIDKEFTEEKDDKNE